MMYQEYEDDDLYEEYPDLRDQKRFEGMTMDQIESLLEDEAVARALQDEAISSWCY